MNQTPGSPGPTTLTISVPTGGHESELLTQAEMSALAHFVRRVGWFEFSSHTADDDEAHMVKQALDKLENVLMRSGFYPEKDQAQR